MTRKKSPRKQVVMGCILAGWYVFGWVAASFLSLSGCAGLKAPQESSVDTRLSKPAPPSLPPVVPREPREGLEQEPTGTR